MAFHETSEVVVREGDPKRGRSFAELRMPVGPMALFERSLRVDARTLEPHLARFSMMFFIYLIVLFAVWTIPFHSAAGLRLVIAVAYLNLVFVTLMGIGIFSSVITEEREDGMLDLILLAGMSPLGILLAKSSGRLIQALLLIAVQYPFMAFAVTLGGVTAEQVRALYVALFSYAFMLMGIGLACSTISRLHRSASILMMVAVAVYVSAPLICDQILLDRKGTDSIADTALSLVAKSSLFLRIGDIFVTDFRESWCSPQVISNLLLGLISFCASCVLFRNAAVQLSAEATNRGWLSRSQNRWRWFSPGRPWANPWVWKDFFFVAGGFPFILIRIATYAALYLVVVRLVMSIFGGAWPPEAQNVATQFYLVTIPVVLCADAGNLVARSFREEVQSQTLGTLRLLPASTGRILYAKVFGLLLGLLPGVLCFALAIVLLPFGTTNFDLLYAASGRSCLIVAHLLLIPHAAAIWAMLGRSNALSLALFTTTGSLILTGILVAVLGRYQAGLATWTAGLAVLGLCGVCHYAVRHQVERQ